MAELPVYTLLDAVGATTIGTGVRTDAPGALILVSSATVSSATVLIQGSMDNVSFQTLKSVADPAAAPAGSAYMGTAWPYMRAHCSVWASGAVSATMALLDYDPGAWKTAEAPTATATDISVATVTCTKLIDDDLTSGRVTIATTSGELTDHSGLLFDGTYLTAPSIKDTAATATRVPYAGASKELAYNAAFTFTASGAILASTVLKGGMQVTAAAYAVDGAISVASQVAMLTQDAVGAYTLAAPTSTTHDGYVMYIVATKARAHVITFASGKINGGSNITITLGGAIGDGATLVAYGGVWWMVGDINATVAA